MLACLTGSRQWVIRSFLLIPSLSAWQAGDLRSNFAAFLRYAGFSGKGVAATDAQKTPSISPYSPFSIFGGIREERRRFLSRRS